METSEGGARGVLGLHIMKGPDYRPELDQMCGRERGTFSSSCSPPPPPASGLLWERSRQMAKWRRKKEEAGEGHEAPGLCKESVWDGTLQAQEDLRPDTGAGSEVLTPSLCRGAVHRRSEQEHVQQPAQAGGLPGWLSGLPGLGGPQRPPPGPHRGRPAPHRAGGEGL